jgi:hypothetical protein
MAGQREMLDEFALALGSPAGMALARGGSFELRRGLRRGDEVGFVLNDLELAGHGGTPSLKVGRHAE